MCDQTEDLYGDGDVVWVKFGPVWWPGVVKVVGEDVYSGLKTKPIAAVKFFDEDTYEFVKNLEHIYHFNNKRKDEFIKKGMDKFRSGAKHMVKFPEDVGKAEELVGGSADIINDPKYGPEEKVDYKALFGSQTPAKKETKTKELQLKTKMLPLKKRKSAPARMLANKSANQPAGQYSCPFCGFSSNMVGALSAHVTFSHSSHRVDYGSGKSTPVQPPKPLKSASTVKKRAKPKQTKSKQKSKTEETLGDDQSQDASVTLTTPEKSTVKSKKYTDALIADWSDADESDNLVVSTLKAPPATPSKEDEKPEEIEKPVSPPSPSKKVAPKSPVKPVSCFDFDDDDDGFIGMSNANTYGRKIPRVIPSKDKTDLGMDLEFEELFKRKNDSNEGDDSEEEEEVVVKKRGRPLVKGKAKATPPTSVKKVKKDTTFIPTLAATRSRRSAARKSYVNEEIRAITEPEPSDVSEREDSPPPLPVQKRKYTKKALKSDEDKEEEPAAAAAGSPKKVDKSPKRLKIEEDLLKQLGDDPTDQEKMEEEVIRRVSEDSEPQQIIWTPPEPVSRPPVGDGEPSKSSRRKQDLKRSSLVELDDLLGKKTRAEEPEPKEEEALKPKLLRILHKKPKGEQADLEAQVESLLAETVAPVIPKATKTSVVKQINDDFMTESAEYPDSPVASPVKTLPILSPKKWREDLKEKLVGSGEPTVVKKSVIPQWKQGIQEQLRANQDPLVSPVKGEVEVKEPVNVVKRTGVVQAITPKKYIIVGQNRPKILGKPVGNQQLMLVQKGTPQQRIKVLGTSPAKPGTSGIAQASSSPQYVQFKTTKKLILGQPSSPATTKKLITFSREGGMRVIKNLEGTGQTIIINNSGGNPTQTIYKMKKASTSATEPQKQAHFINREGKVIRVGSSFGPQQQRTIIVKRREPKPVPVPEPEPEVQVVPEVIQEPVQEAPAAPLVTNQQLIAMPVTKGGQTSYMIVTVDESGNYQPVDNSYENYGIQNEQSEMYDPTQVEQETPTYAQSSGSQDILQNALALANVLETEAPLNIGHENQHSLDQPGMLISPVTHETAALTEPIMTAQELPSPVVVDATELEPPPLPPTPDEDALMDDEGGLMIAEQPLEDGEMVAEETEEEDKGTEVQQEAVVEEQLMETDTQESENTTFESMPLLTEENGAEEPIGDQSFHTQLVQPEPNEYLPSSTNPDLEPEPPADIRESLDDKDVTEDGVDSVHPSQETEVTSTTQDSSNTSV